MFPQSAPRVACLPSKHPPKTDNHVERMMKRIYKHLACTLAAAFPLVVQAQNWQQVTDEAVLRGIMTNTVLSGELKEGVRSTSTFNADGTGELRAWNGRFPRTWTVEDQQICVVIDDRPQCFRIEQDEQDSAKYRAIQVDTGVTTPFNVSDQGTEIVGAPPSDSSGGAAAPSAEEMALKLSNPTAPVMTLGNNLDIVMFDGDVDGASDETSIRYVFQSVFPFKLDDVSSILFRPAIPVFFDEPVPQLNGDFSSEGVNLGDIGFDLLYGRTEKSGLLWGFGAVGTLPTSTSDVLGKDLWAAGPEALVGKIGKWGALIGVLSHQWDFAGSGKGEVDITTLNYVYAFQLGGGWQFASAPAVTYDHSKSDDKLTLPLGVGIAKTVFLGGRPWKFQVQYWNYVERADPFAPEHQIRLSANPVVSATWNQ